MRDAPDEGTGAFSVLNEIATPGGAPEGRTREVLHSSGSKLIETMYSSDASTRVCKYALLGPLGFGSDSDFMTAMCGLKVELSQLLSPFERPCCTGLSTHPCLTRIRLPVS